MSNVEQDKKSEAATDDIEATDATPVSEDGTGASENSAPANDDSEAAAADAPEAESAAEESDGEVAEEAEEEAEEAEAEPEPPTPEEEIAALKDQLLRAMAETENVRRRGQRELDDVRKFAIADFARDLLGLSDNLARALESAGAGDSQSGLVEGVELTQRQLQQTFEKFGIQPFDALGQKLDPNLHQAMMQIEDGDAVPGTVVQVIQTGYVIHDRLLRPALVGVAKAPAAAEEEEPATEAEADADEAAPEAGQHIDTKA